MAALTAAAGGVNITVQRPWAADRPLLSAGVMRRLWLPRHYGEVGIDVLPGGRVEEVNFKGVKGCSYALYGMHVGYYLTVIPFFRPGIHVGTSFRQKEYRRDGVIVGYGSWKVAPYFGCGVHVGLLSFVVSNEGIGGGVNVQWGRVR